MANEIILRDQNFITVLAGVTDNAALEIRMLRINPTTGRLLVSGVGGGGAVDSVNGQTGAVILDTDDISDSGATNKYFTNALARGAISLTTTGTSGAATYTQATGVFNIPQYSGTMAIGGTVTGGTQGSVLFLGAANVLAQDNTHFFWNDANNRLGIGTATPRGGANGGLDVFGADAVLSVGNATDFLFGGYDIFGGELGFQFQSSFAGSGNLITYNPGSLDAISIGGNEPTSGNLYINQSTGAVSIGGYVDDANILNVTGEVTITNGSIIVNAPATDGMTVGTLGGPAIGLYSRLGDQKMVEFDGTDTYFYSNGNIKSIDGTGTIIFGPVFDIGDGMTTGRTIGSNIATHIVIIGDVDNAVTAVDPGTQIKVYGNAGTITLSASVSVSMNFAPMGGDEYFFPTTNGVGSLFNDGSGTLVWSPAGSGDVTGGTTSLVNMLPRYDSTDGKVIKDSGVILADIDGNNNYILSAIPTTGATGFGLILRGGSTDTDQDGGGVAIFGANGSGTGAGGSARVVGGNSGTGVGLGGDATMEGGLGGEDGGKGGDIRFLGGNAQGGDSDGGSIIMLPGVTDGAGLNGIVLMGINFDPTAGTSPSILTIGGNGQGVGSMQAFSASDTNGGDSSLGAFSARGLIDAPTGMLTDDRIGGIYLGGYGSTTYNTTASISAFADEDFDDSNKGTRIEIATTPIGDFNRITRIIIGSDGTTTFRSQIFMAASTTTLATFNIPSGTAPTSPNDGDIWYDGTNLKMRIGGSTKTFTLI